MKTVNRDLNYFHIFAVKPHFTDRKIKNFMVLQAGNSARINFNFQVQDSNIHNNIQDALLYLQILQIKTYVIHRWQACPIPTIKWLKDGHPVAKNVSVDNTETSSQLMIPATERSDTGIYTILVKNLVGQDSSSIEIRVTGTKDANPNPKMINADVFFSEKKIKHFQEWENQVKSDSVKKVFSHIFHK